MKSWKLTQNLANCLGSARGNWCDPKLWASHCASSSLISMQINTRLHLDAPLVGTVSIEPVTAADWDSELHLSLPPSRSSYKRSLTPF